MMKQFAGSQQSTYGLFFDLGLHKLTRILAWLLATSDGFGRQVPGLAMVKAPPSGPALHHFLSRRQVEAGW